MAERCQLSPIICISTKNCKFSAYAKEFARERRFEFDPYTRCVRETTTNERVQSAVDELAERLTTIRADMRATTERIAQNAAA